MKKFSYLNYLIPY